MFWIGFIVGLFVGANMGILVMGLLIASRDEKPCTTLPQGMQGEPCTLRGVQGKEAL